MWIGQINDGWTMNSGVITVLLTNRERSRDPWGISLPISLVTKACNMWPLVISHNDIANSMENQHL